MSTLVITNSALLMCEKEKKPTRHTFSHTEELKRPFVPTYKGEKPPPPSHYMMYQCDECDSVRIWGALEGSVPKIRATYASSVIRQ